MQSRPVEKKHSTLELRVIGLIRSGHHAFIHWLFGHFSGEVVFRNNVSELEREVYVRKPVAGPRRDAYLFNVESPSLDTLVSLIDSDRWNTWAGTSEQMRYALVLRDPYNQFASRIKLWGYGSFQGHTAAEELALWKSYAMEYLGDTRHLPDGTIKVLYNTWFSDVAYRRLLSCALSLRFSDATLNELTMFGSSFDGRNGVPAISEGQQLNVLGRWRHFAKDPGFQAFMRDDEMHDLAERAFGTFAVRIREEIDVGLSG